MDKEEVQKRVFKKDKPIDINSFTWDEKNLIFYSELSHLTFNFKGIDNCNFYTKEYCTFETGSYCNFYTYSDCKFNTGSNCIFTVGDYCFFTTGDFCTFNTYSYCHFNTGYGCTFKTSNRCTFKTSDNCVFNTGFKCIFDTGSNCVFGTDSGCIFNTKLHCIFKVERSCTFNTGWGCVILTTLPHQVIEPPATKKITLCPYAVEGYVDEKGYLNGDKSLGKYIVADGILSKIIKQKSNVYKVINQGQTKETYLIKQGNKYAHGKTLKEAKESIIYKLADRDTTRYNFYNLDTILTKEEGIEMYMVITGACSYGTKMFVDMNVTKDKYSIKEIIDLTADSYGNEDLVNFFKNKN